MEYNNEIVEYLIELENMNSDQLKLELEDYKKVINDLSKASSKQFISYNLYLALFKVLNLFSSNYYYIAKEVKGLKVDILYEKEALNIMKLVIKYLNKTHNYEDVDCFYLTLVAITKFHNDRYLYSKNLFDMYSSNSKGINVILPNQIDYNNQELKSNINDSLDVLVKKIK